MSRRFQTHATLLAPLIVVTLFLAGALPLILSQNEHGRAAADQNIFHLPVIHAFARQLPHPDFRDYASATTPGFHLVVAAVSRAVGSSNEVILRLIGSCFTVALLVIVAIAIARRTVTLNAIILCLPIVTSPYVFPAGAWLLPDNAGWLLVVLAMMLALEAPVDGRFFIGEAIILLALVCFRQPYLCLAGTFVVAAMTATRQPDTHNGKVKRSISASKAVGLAIIAALPAVAALAYFFHLWHGVVPPNQRTLVGGGNPAVPAILLGTIGAIGVFYIGFLPRRALTINGATSLVVGGCVGLAAAVLPVTTISIEGGRFSGIWNIVPRLPVLFGRTSVAIATLSVIGGALSGVWLYVLPARVRWICIATLLAFAAALSANHNAYYRYGEPGVLLSFAFLSASASPRRFWPLAGPLLLTLLQAGITASAIR